MAARRSNPDFLNGVPELLILQLLSRRPMHGYELVQAIAAATGGEIRFSEGCIYPLLHRLELDGALDSRRERTGGRSRVVYRLSATGRKRLSHSTSRWNAVATAVRGVLQGGTHGHAKLA